MVFKGTRIVIAIAGCKNILCKVHEGHMGIEKCCRRARDVVCWPGMSAEISDMVEQRIGCPSGGGSNKICVLRLTIFMGMLLPR